MMPQACNNTKDAEGNKKERMIKVEKLSARVNRETMLNFKPRMRLVPMTTRSAKVQ